MTLQQLRETILKMKRYFVHCRNALDRGILLNLASRQHFVENTTSFSMLDLVHVHDGTLLNELRSVCDQFAQHIRNDCPVCKCISLLYSPRPRLQLVWFVNLPGLQEGVAVG
jgi:hypothetical protein